MTLFREKVLSIVKRIPRGKTLSYKEVARRAGNAHAARAVGTILKKNHNTQIPCHRVIHSNGDVGGYNQGGERKIQKLRSEDAIPFNK